MCTQVFRPLRSLVLAIAAAAAAGPAAGQGTVDPDTAPARQVDIALAGGLFFSSDWSDLVVLGIGDAVGGVFERVLLRDVAVSPGGMGDVAVTYWRGRYGVRVHAGFSSSCLSVGPGCVEHVLTPKKRAELGIVRNAQDVNSWVYDIAGVVALREPPHEKRLLPYVFAGFGGVSYDPGAAIRRLLPSFVAFGGLPGRLVPDVDDVDVLVIGGGTDFILSADEVGFETALSGHFGIGAKLRFPLGDGGFALVVEAADHVIRSPLEVRVVFLRRDFDLSIFGFDSDDELEEVEFDFGLVHNLRLVAGIAFEVPIGHARGAARLLRNE